MDIDPEVLALARTAFQHARAGETTQLAGLLAAGLPANLTNERGDSLLMLASYYGHRETTRVLLEHKADPERTNDRGQTPLAGATFKGDIAIVRMLLDHGAQVDGRGPDGKTPLMFAAMFDQLEIMDLLIARGAVLDRMDAARRTALDYCHVMGARRTAERLVELFLMKRELSKS
jgi:hypothetical protein